MSAVPVVLGVHIVMGSVGLLSGYVALFTAKGAPLHRKAGLVFVSVMLGMAMTGIVLAIAHGTWAEVNVSAGLMAAYLVTTGWTALRPRFRARWRGRSRSSPCRASPRRRRAPPCGEAARPWP